MPWVLLDDAFNDHPKWASAPCDSIAMWIAALAWCNHNERWDGRIPTVRLRGLVNARNPTKTIGDLEARGAIHRDGADHLIHDFTDWQQVDRKRAISEVRRAAGRKGGRTTQERLRASNGSSTSSSNCSTNSSSQPPTTNHRVQVRDNSTPENTPEGVDNSRREQVLDLYATGQLEAAKAKGTKITSEERYRSRARTTGARHPDLDRWLALFPTAPASAVAAWLAGDKHSMAYFTQPDETDDEPIATVHPLNRGTA